MNDDRDQQIVMVLPRAAFDGLAGFIPREQAEGLVNELNKAVTWLPRSEAEHSSEWVQPIPCTLLRQAQGRYCVLRRISGGRHDLSDRVSLLVGGHVDWTGEATSLRRLLQMTLFRELYEEVHLQELRNPRMIGVAIDRTSVASSRHVAFVYQATPGQPISVDAPEEFAARSSITGKCLSVWRLSLLAKTMDPWSRIVFDNFIASTSTRRPSLSAAAAP